MMGDDRRPGESREPYESPRSRQLPSSGLLALEQEESQSLIFDSTTRRPHSRSGIVASQRAAGHRTVCAIVSVIGICVATLLLSVQRYHKAAAMGKKHTATQMSTGGAVVWPAETTKLGAGLLITVAKEGKTYALLLLRNSKHNGNTWGLPGGNVEPEDASLHDTAWREAREEVGHLPRGLVEMGEVLTRRGDGGKKFFTVYVFRADPGELEEYSPELDPGESKDWRWVDIEQLLGRQVPMHPVTELLFHGGGVKEQIASLLATEPTATPTPRSLVGKPPAAAVPDPRSNIGPREALPAIGGGAPLREHQPQPKAEAEAEAEVKLSSSTSRHGADQQGLQLSDPLTSDDFKSPPLPRLATKLGAGLLFVAVKDEEPHLLLLYRDSTKNNGDTWGLPGGNLHAGETLAEAAVRKARDDLGIPPPAKALGHITTRRGKKKDKYYTVFVAITTVSVMETYSIQLGPREHSAGQWIPLSDITAHKLEVHPVVDVLVSDANHMKKLRWMLLAAASPVGPSSVDLSQLEPLTAAFPSPQVPESAEKTGAGLLFMSSHCDELHALLLYRNSKHNGETWGLPGGNLDKGETLAEVAVREAAEEMGHPPPAKVLGHIATRRGKHKQKFYVVFVAYVSGPVMEAYEPDLDMDEHSAWRWVPLAEMLGGQLPLHPVVDMVVHDKDYFAQLQRLVSPSPSSSEGACAQLG